MNENSHYMNQPIEGRNFYQPQINSPAPNTIYSDLQNTIYKNSSQLNKDA